MSYRPPEQSIAEPAEALAGAINTFSDAVEARLRSGEWKASHIDELSSLVCEMTPLWYKLVVLSRNTW